MEIHIDCLPCMLRQVLEASRMATNNEEVLKKIMDRSIGFLNRYESYGSSPEMVGEFHKIVKEMTGEGDPYRKIKQRDIRIALRILPDLKRSYAGREDEMYWALKAAAVGNVLDSAIDINADVEKDLEAEIEKPFEICDIGIFKEKLKGARSVLVIGDNAGETVFDTTVLEKLFLQRVYYAVRNTAVINDATMEDARASGISRYGTIVSTGCDAPGTILNQCSREFLELFYGADIVIAKGQGNYESLLGCDREIFFLLKAKCYVLSKSIGVGLNGYVFQHYKPKDTESK
jgi:uncharacterized protein with ATP-grasp and redox domains